MAIRGAITYEEMQAVIASSVAVISGTPGPTGPTGPPAGVATLSTATLPIGLVESVAISTAIPANAMAVGTTYRLWANGLATVGGTAGTTTFRVRIGALTLTGAIAQSSAPVNVASKANFPIAIIALVTCRATGAGGSVFATLMPFGPTIAAAGVAAGVTANTSVDTTQARVLELTVQSSLAANTVTIHNAAIERVMP